MGTTKSLVKNTLVDPSIDINTAIMAIASKKKAADFYSSNKDIESKVGSFVEKNLVPDKPYYYLSASTTNIVSAEIGGVTTVLGLATMKAGVIQTGIGIPALASGKAGVVPIATGFATTTAGAYATEYGGYILNNSIKDQNYNYSKFEEAIGADGVSSKMQKTAMDITKKAKDGKIRFSSDAHGRLGKELELDILSNPDTVYLTSGKAQKLIYRKGENVVIVESAGSAKGNILTSYGPGGPRGSSGASVFGGSPNEPGMPVTHEQIISGNVPRPNGENMPPAIQIYPQK